LPCRIWKWIHLGQRVAHLVKENYLNKFQIRLIIDLKSAIFLSFEI